MKIAGLMKLTLLDYPGEMACTIFTSSCNFRCPFCHNSSLVINTESNKLIDNNEVLSFLKERTGRLDGVCITGGEPTIQEDLTSFIKEIKNIGYKVKLDTNGYNPKKLKELISSNLVDYVAMDIKNSLSKYPLTCGLKAMMLENVLESISYLLENHVDYEFRTTIIKEFHEENDLKEIAKLIKGCKRYFLQQFEDTPYNIQKGFHAHSIETLNRFKEILLKEGIQTELRGI